jgi:integrase
VLFLANTGLRHGTETKNLKWKHISETTINGEKYILIKLEKGKTGKRTIVCRHSVRKYLVRIKDRFPHLKERQLGQMLDIDEPVFRCRDGSIPKDYHGAFRIMLEKAKLLNDVNGSRRSLYSLRHTYATFRLQEGVNHYILARNMGTSVKMLEQHYGHTSNRAMADELTKHKEKKREKLAWE